MRSNFARTEFEEAVRRAKEPSTLAIFQVVLAQRFECLRETLQRISRPEEINPPTCTSERRPRITGSSPRSWSR